MRLSRLGKFLALAVLYVVIIVGIFVLEFKSDPVISGSSGDLSYVFFGTQGEDGSQQLDNRFMVTFKGLTFLSDGGAPVTVTGPAGERVNCELVSFHEDADSLTAFFTNGVSVTFGQRTGGGSDAGGASLSISVNQDGTPGEVSVPYVVSRNYTAEQQSPENILFSSEGIVMSLTAHAVRENAVAFSPAENTAHYSAYTPGEEFSFDRLEYAAGTTDGELDALSLRLRARLVRDVEDAVNASRADGLSELEIAAYVAELASQNQYERALSFIPDPLKAADRVTYVSAPFFGNLVSASESLAAEEERRASLVQSAPQDALEERGIADYLLRRKNTAEAAAFIDAVSRLQSPGVLQAAGIINIYADLVAGAPALAAPLEGLLDACVSRIEVSCALEDAPEEDPDAARPLRLADEEGDALGASEAVFAGDALKKLGALRGDAALSRAGNLLIYTALSSPEVDSETISELYGVIASENRFFPHAELLGWYGETCVWAWTCSPLIAYRHDEPATAHIAIDFPVELSHYVTFCGIPDFAGQIEIYGLMYRTDPRFETYDSSGYVYRSETQNLFLKSVHRNQSEQVRLFFDSPREFEAADAAARPASP